MIKTNQLSKVFRTFEVETTALNKVELNVASGEFIAIMGPSGCGKSSLLNILGLLDNPTKGQYISITLKFQDIRKINVQILEKGTLVLYFKVLT